MFALQLSQSCRPAQTDEEFEDVRACMRDYRGSSAFKRQRFFLGLSTPFGSQNRVSTKPMTV
jgi:hypothetical protein